MVMDIARWAESRGELHRTDMSKEEIISAVFERRTLWDPSHPLHKHAGVLKKHWGDISTKLNITGTLYVLFHISGATILQLIQIILRIDDIIMCEY